jgi:PST family polysaccharide transporter
VTKGVQAAARPLNQLFFPRALRALQEMVRPDREALRRLLKFVFPQWLALAGVIAVLAAGYLLARQHGVLGRFPQSERIALLVGMMLPSVFFGVGNFILGSAGLNHLNARGDLLRLILAVGLLNLPVCVLLSRSGGEHGAAASFVAAEAMLFALMVRLYRRGSEREVADVR